MILHRGKEYLTQAEVMRIFNVSHMTLFNWRRGSPRRTSLPMVQLTNPDTGRKVWSITPKMARAWATHNNVELNLNTLNRIMLRD